MEFIKCPVCGVEVLDSTTTCPICGCTLTVTKQGKSRKHTGGKYVRHRQKKNRLGYVALGLLAVVVFGTIAFSIILPNGTEPQPSAKMYSPPTETENEDIMLTRESLTPYLDVLGMETGTGDSLEVSQEFIDGLGSVYIMGRTGSVMHGFTTDSGVIVDSMEWADNSSATRAEFDEFINSLREYFGKGEEAVKSYDNISEETYLWIDASYNAYVLCWYKSGRINMRWDYQKSLDVGATANQASTQKVNKCIRCGIEIDSGATFCVDCLATPIDELNSPAKKKDDQKKTSQHTCEVSGCYRSGEYNIIGISGKTEYYCKEHMKEMEEMANMIMFTNKYGTPTTVCAHKGCTNYIASSGNTNCCERHSRNCLSCGKYIDEDAMYCVGCLAEALLSN